MSRLDLSLTAEELETYLRDRRTVRVATLGPERTPHVVPLWFVWHEGVMFLNSTLGNPTVENLLREGRAAGVVDDGETYDELRGAVVTGTASRAEDDPRLPEVERAWSRKYLGGSEPPYRLWRNRVWLRIEPERVSSWDFRKIPEAKARRAAARAKEA
jgi:nitroimidazol reductase NimA-like FMN-containing flavoprotein (pyridoxamine 5'-phosphate oxidase superfamily)